MNTKINIYSPVEGVVKNLKDLNDGVFSEGMLGDGFYIEPTSDEFYSIFDQGELVQIFDTKHAYYFKGFNGPTVLMHIGLETVKLEGKYFKVFAKEKTKLDLKTKIVDVDLKNLEKNKIAKSTIIVSDSVESQGWTFHLLKKGDVKQGEIIGHFRYKLENDSIKPNSLKPNLEILQFQNKFTSLAENIYNSIGGKTNYKTFWNCITRLRFDIKNKLKVDEISLKKDKNVKGVIWSKNELQIVIGPEVIKARDAYENLLIKINSDKDTIDSKIGWFNLAKNNVSGIMTMLIPYLIASGMLYALMNVFIQTGIMKSVEINYFPTSIEEFKRLIDYDVVTGVLYIICTSGISFMAYMFGYCTIKFMKGNTVVGSLILITLLAPQLFGGLSWKLFSIGKVDFLVQGYAQTIIPQVFAAVLYVKIDKWIKSWIPGVLDIVLRHMLCVLTVCMLTFFALGPALGVLELFFYYVLLKIETLPFGIAQAIFSALTVPLTVLGIAWAVTAPITASIAKGNPSALSIGWGIGEFSQAGAVFAVALKTKNKNLRTVAISGGVTGLFGITEPLLYSVNLPKFKPFICGIISAFVAGWIFGSLGLKVYTSGGGGLFFFTVYLTGGWEQVLIASICMVFSFSLSFIMTYFSWSELMNQKKNIEKINLYIYKKMIKNTNLEEKSLEEYKTMNAKILNLFNNDYKALDTDFQKLIKSKISIELTINNAFKKQEKYQSRLQKKAINLQSQNKFKEIESLNHLYLNNKYKDKIFVSLEQIKQSEKNLTLQTKKLNESQSKILKDLSELIKYTVKILSSEKINFKSHLVEEMYDVIINNTKYVFDLLPEKKLKQKKLIFANI